MIDGSHIVRGNPASRWQNRSPVSLAVFLPQIRVLDGSTVQAPMTVGDQTATRTVYITIVLLVALGLGLAILAVWLFKRTRPEPELLAPLEEMDTRAWRKQDPAAQRRALDAIRPPGARPVHREAAVPDVDDEFAAARPAVGFEDLADDAHRDANDNANDDATDGPAGGEGVTEHDEHNEPEGDVDGADTEHSSDPDVDVETDDSAADDTADADTADDDTAELAGFPAPESGDIVTDDLGHRG